MSIRLNRIIAVLLSLLLAAALFPMTAYAAGMIDTTRPIQFSISYKDGAKAIPNARFSVYKVADVDEYAEMTVSPAFSGYRYTVSGLNRLNDLKQDEWMTLASTLKGYVLRDSVPSVASGFTDSDGGLSFPDFTAGLYLVIGSRATTDDFYTYTAVPFMVFLPGSDPVGNTWEYEVTASPKYSKDYDPPETEDEFISRKVLKIWDDNGYESLRPTELIVQLLKDGEVYDTQTLSKANNWRYAWDNLSKDNEWEIVEKEVEGYAVSVTRTGITFTISNKFIVPIVGTDIPVHKRLTGEIPTERTRFTFIFSAEDTSCPMPEGSKGTVKEISVFGAGTRKVGEITFSAPGIYEYTIRERDDGVEGYTYDKSVYTVTYYVTKTNGKLSADVTVSDESGKEVSTVEFTNSYKKPHEKLPQTGALWWPVPVLLGVGVAFLFVGMISKRRYY